MLHFLKLLIVITTSIGCGSGSTFHLEISPNKINRLIPTHNVTVSCLVKDNHTYPSEILVMEIKKDREGPLAAVRQCSNASILNGEQEHIHIEGQLDRNQNLSFLRMTLLNPATDDAGTYTCLIVRLDTNGSLKKEDVKANLSIDPDEVSNYLRDKVSSFENRLKTAEDTIRTQGKYIAELESKISTHELNAPLHDLISLVHHNIKELEKHEQLLKTHEDQIRNQISTLHVNENRLEIIEDRVRNQSKHFTELYDRSNKMEAFSAIYNSKDTFKTGGTIVFSQVLMKAGNGYDETTGVFTAPISGFYAFHLTVTTAAKKMYENIDLRVNGKIQVLLFAYGSGLYGDQSSVSCTVKLQVGDKVEVVSNNKSPGALIHSTSVYSLFTGYLIKRV